MNREIIQGKGFWISYAQAGSGPTGDETALCNGSTFYILNGNWLEDYRPLVKKGYKECKKFFDEHAGKYINFWSD